MIALSKVIDSAFISGSVPAGREIGPSEGMVPAWVVAVGRTVASLWRECSSPVPKGGMHDEVD
jgi:hypothetical protein